MTFLVGIRDFPSSSRIIGKSVAAVDYTYGSLWKCTYHRL
jgi:hypothetical protein